MKVLFLYKYLTVGGVETVLRSRIPGLSRLGVESEAWFLKDGPGRSLFEGFENRAKIGNLRRLSAHLANEPPDLLVNIDTPEAFEPTNPLQIPLVVEVHTPYAENKDYLRTIHKQPVEKILVPSLHQAQEVLVRIRQEIPVAVIPNPLPEVLTVNKATNIPRHPESVLAWIGRLDRLKNWRGFLKVAIEVIRRHTSSMVWVIGEAPQISGNVAFLKEVARSGLAGRLKWFPRLSQQALALVLAIIRESGGIVLSTSRGESFGMTIAEAMSVSCPVVVPDAGPFREFVHNGRTGLLYEPEKYHQAADCVLDLLSQSEMRSRLGDAGRRSILEYCDPQLSIGNLAKELHQTVTGKRRAA